MADQHPVDLMAALQRSIDCARRIDRTPCPRCGGNRLRVDFTGSGRCHAPLPAAPTEEPTDV